MIYKEINFYDFSDAFEKMDRGNHFTYAGKKLLFDFFELESYELDIIAICCDFTEYTNWQDLAVEYDLDSREDLIKYLQDRTLVLYDNETIVVQNF
jgi:hypothetical protein